MLVDEYTRECLAIDVAGSIWSGRVIDVLSRVISERGVLRSDNGPEFVSTALRTWAKRKSLWKTFFHFFANAPKDAIFQDSARISSKRKYRT